MTGLAPGCPSVSKAHTFTVWSLEQVAKHLQQQISTRKPRVVFVMFPHQRLMLSCPLSPLLDATTETFVDQ